MSLNNSLPDQLETGRPSPSNTITPSTSSTGYIVSSPPNPLKSPLTRPTALERFLEPSNFTELFPSIRPHLIKGDLKRLAQVPGVFNRVATITLYQESVVELASESPSCLGQQFYFLVYGLNRPSPVGRISKKEALSFVKSMDLFMSSPAQALALLDIPFPRLQKVIIWARYLREILLQSHAETATITSETPYTDFHNPNKPFDFPEARLITHLASYATVVEIFVPGTSHYDEGEDEWHEHRSEVGYYLDESKLEPKELESGIWSSYLAIVPYQKRFPPGTVMDDWWNVPDLGDRLSLNRIKPIDTLVLWIHDASNTFHQLPSKNLIIALGPRVLRDEAGCLYSIDELPELAVIRYLLDFRAVTSSKVIIRIHPPPYIAIMQHIVALYPHLLVDSNQLAGRDPTVPDMSCEWELEKRIKEHKGPGELSELETDASMEQLEIVKTRLFERHAKTDVEKADFEQIKFSYRERERWDEVGSDGWTVYKYSRD